jgi:hypothetical protein
MTASSTQDLSASRIAAKQTLRAALAKHDGDPAPAEVAAAIARLETLNPTPCPARHPDMEGNWRLISAPNFPDGELQPDGTYAYTLGRLAFNMFAPQTLKVVIEEVSQPVLPIAGTSQLTHDIVVQFITVGQAGTSLRGLVRNLGVCAPSSDNTLQVQFTGGVLAPTAETDRQQWRELFDRPASPGSFNLKEWLQGLFLKFMFGLVPPQGMAENGQVEFQMQRSPKGTLSVVYLDDELRITRSRKEKTVLVCERV